MTNYLSFSEYSKFKCSELAELFFKLVDDMESPCLDLVKCLAGKLDLLRCDTIGLVGSDLRDFFFQVQIAVESWI